jgi:copper binding plastocyanin/azurin family protein
VPSLTATVPGASTPTPTPPTGGPTPTPAPPSGNRIVDVGENGGDTFVDQVSGNSATTIAVGTTVEWRWVSGTHSVTSGTCTVGCAADGQFDSGTGSGMTFTHVFPSAGTFPYFCRVHGAMMTGIVTVQ